MLIGLIIIFLMIQVEIFIPKAGQTLSGTSDQIRVWDLIQTDIVMMDGLKALMNL
jgi:hypothetical protein